MQKPVWILLATSILPVTHQLVRAQNAETVQTNTESASLSLNTVPSTLWPAFVTSKKPIETIDGMIIPANYRGTLIRCENNQLLVDFGRYGVRRIDTLNTDFKHEMEKLLSGEKVKEYGNLTLQIGNKLFAFNRSRNQSVLKLEEVAPKDFFILIYLNQYNSNEAQDLIDLAEAYTELTTVHPKVIGVIMPEDEAIYDFAFTVSYPIPLITPHLRKGYRASLSHGADNSVKIVLCDLNGDILYQSDALQTTDLAEALKTAATHLP